jgi:DNA-binding GntR family transcriptional regulator
MSPREPSSPAAPLRKARKKAGGDRTLLADKAYDLLEQMIVTLELPPGSTVSESELVKRLRFGRTPLREALLRLEEQRLVTTLPRRGTVVSDISIVDYLSLLETRRVLDRLVATKAARRASPEQRKEFERIARGMEGAAAKDGLEHFMLLDGEFDRLLEEAARSAFAVRALLPLHTHCRRFWYRYRHSGDLPRAAELHADLSRAVVEGDESGAGNASDALVAYLEEFAREALDLT